MSNSISTLYELNQSLADLGSKSDFEELNLGPLLKQPVVYDMFKAPQGLSQVPHVTTIQILKHLEKYMTKEDLWRKKVDLGKFMEYLSEEYQCGTPFDLGVRIQSIGLAISVMLLNFCSYISFFKLKIKSNQARAFFLPFEIIIVRRWVGPKGNTPLVNELLSIL